jgi:hypothetical protein
MAVRVHVTAVRDVKPDDVRLVFTNLLGQGFEQVTLHEHGGWVSFSTSVWGGDSAKLHRGLCELAKPGIQVTSSDGCRWYLTIYGGPTGPMPVLHEFYNHRSPADPSRDEEVEADYAARARDDQGDPELAFLEDDRPARPNRPPRAFDGFAESFREMGAPLPDSFVESVIHLPYHQAFNRFREWYADDVAAALARAGIPVDARAVRQVLLWEGVTEREADSDLGNLPRFLSVLGLGGEWDEWVRQAENPPPEETCAACDEASENDARTREPSRDFHSEIQAIAQDFPLEPIVGGPVDLSLKVYHRLGFFAAACIPTDGLIGAVTAELPADCVWKDQEELEHTYSDTSISMTPNGFKYGVSDTRFLEWDMVANNLGEKRTKQFRNTPAGSILEVAFADPSAPQTCQRYRGKIVERVWHIEATYPPLRAETLSAALELAKRADKTKFECRDEAEADAVMQAVAKDDYLYNMDVKRKGTVVKCAYDVGFLAKILFRHRFADAWNVAFALEHIEREYLHRLDQTKKMRLASLEAARQRTAPRVGEVLWVGTQTRFWRSDFDQLTQLEPEPRLQFEAALRNQGFELLGDLTCKKQRDVVLRLGISRDHFTYGVLMGKRTMYLGWEYVTTFADGSSLTTTTNGAASSYPEVGHFIKHAPGLDPAALYEKHLWGIERFRSHRGTAPVASEPTLVGVAKAIDGAFARVEPVQAREMAIEQVRMEDDSE